MGTGGRPYGVLGRVLGHSYSPAIYQAFAGLDYVTFEREPDEVEDFLRGREWEGVNVTIPYKRTAAAICDELTPVAARMGNVNTITRLPDGRLLGDNTDYAGFRTLAQSLGVNLSGRKAVVFGGDGGAGSTVMQVLPDLGAHPVAITRGGADNYTNLSRHADAAIAVNCTPVGMAPNCPDSVVSLDALPALEGLIDVVYNPARTGLQLQAEERGIPHAGGLLMLVAQAAAALKVYTGEEVSFERIVDVTDRLSASEQNIALIGMPGCGKTRVGENLARILGRTHVDMDRMFARRLGIGTSEFLIERGEEAFRAQETALLKETAGRSKLVISCGGGVVTRPENHALLHQNSYIVMLNRPLDELSKKGRPLSQREGVQKLAEQRMPTYLSWADLIVDSTDSAAHTAEAVAARLPAML